MNEAMQRLLPAWLLTLAVHGLMLNWRLEQKPIKLPEPEKISVTLRQPPPPPPPQKKIVKELPPPPELKPIERQPLEKLPPPQKKIVRSVRKIPAVKPVQRKPLANLPPRQQKIIRQLPKPPQVTAAALKPLATLPPPQRRIARRMPPPPTAVPVASNLQPMTVPPPAQGRIARQLPRLPVSVDALTKQPLPQPLQTLPPEPEPVWEEVAEEPVQEEVVEEAVEQAAPEEIIEEVGEEPVQETQYEETLAEEVFVEDAPPPQEVAQEVFEAEPVWEEPVAPQPRQRYVRQERQIRQARRRPVEYYERPRRAASRNYEQRAAVSSSSYGSGDQEAAPRYDFNPKPSYPIQARRRGLQGTVMLRVLVDAGGSVADVRLSGSSGYSILDQAAMNSVRGWRFTPGMSGGRPKQMWVEVPVSFVLN